MEKHKHKIKSFILWFFLSRKYGTKLYFIHVYWHKIKLIDLPTIGKMVFTHKSLNSEFGVKISFALKTIDIVSMPYCLNIDFSAETDTKT